MCGIAAIFSTKHPPLHHQIQTMTNAMSHRGPDASDHYVDEHVALGHRRLSIIDLSPLGNQPMWDISGRYGIVYNGELYNYTEIKARLAPYPYRSNSDTEVILAGFAQCGTAIFEQLNGIFAFVIYDKQERCFYAVRDRFGIKPLYYFEEQGVWYFASEQRSIFSAALPKRSINPDAVADYLLNGSVSGHKRICRGLFGLKAGHYLKLELNGANQIVPYKIFFENQIDTHGASESTVVKNVEHLLLKAVERQLMSDVPLGAFLSGGIDSSAIVALMSEVSTQKPLTFTIGFDESRYDESSHADTIARLFNTQHTNITLKPDDFLEELPHALAAMDTPSLDGINTYVVSKVTRKAGVTVALSGLGGDELFAGYATFKRFHRFQKAWFWKIPHVIRHASGAMLHQMAQSSRMRRLGNLIQVSEPTIADIYPQFRSVLDQELVKQLMRNEHKPVNPIQEFLAQHLPTIQQFDTLSQYSIAEMSGYTCYMLLKDTDQMSMASSLEVRVPFFDNDLVDYVLNLPDKIKYPHTPKQLLIKALGNRLPESIINRPKMGFTLPWDQWLRRELKDFAATRITQLCDRNLLHPDLINTMWSDFQHQKHQVQWSHIWMFVVLEEWLQRNIDQTN